MTIDTAFSIDRNIHAIKKMSEEGNFSQLSFAHRVKIVGYGYINKHDI